jgi:tyrosyl-tRNA synthetase
LIAAAGLAESKNAARRLITQGAVEIDGEKVTSETIVLKNGCILKAGKRRFVKIVNSDKKV